MALYVEDAPVQFASVVRLLPWAHDWHAGEPGLDAQAAVAFGGVKPVDIQL